MRDQECADTVAWQLAKALTPQAARVGVVAEGEYRGPCARCGSILAPSQEYIVAGDGFEDHAWAVDCKEEGA
jgi:hypothetical protein